MLVVGDIHFPDRSKQFPSFLPKSDVVAGTGDYTNHTALFEVASLAPVFIGVVGNSDRSIPLPERTSFIYRNVLFGLFHGHGIHPRGDLEQLYAVAKELGVEVLLTGHTHKLGVIQYKDVIIANPGSATGAWGGSTPGEPETALLVSIEGDKITFKSIGDVEKVWSFNIL